jgi:hypothetical protein
VCSAGTLVFDVAGESSWALPPGCTEATFKVWGAGGGSFSTSPAGGAGGFAGGTVTLPSGTALTLRVGQAGAYNATLFTNSGGGLSGVWLADTPLVVAGAGGGAGKTGRGGAAGQNGEGLYFAGKGATTAPGQGGCGNSDGTAWAGGTVQLRRSGTPSGDGGAGRFGGGAGCAVYYNSTYIGGTGGGGSNYVAGTVQNPLSLYGSYSVPGNAGDAARGISGAPSKAGRIVLSYH